jgi:mannose-6-phosphate isomerase
MTDRDTGDRTPILLAPNQPERAYRGGAGIARFRGTPVGGDHVPEDFVGSTTEVFGGGGIGLTVLPDGRRLQDAIRNDPTAWLGAEHVERFGSSTELLVKLLDARQRLFVHAHPDRRFAAEHLSLQHGKTEAWIIVAVEEGALPVAHLGFTRDVSAEEVSRWVNDQDVDAMLSVMHEVPLTVGTTILVPAGTPHAIGAGVTLVELQEPTDLSILLEYTGFPGVGEEDAFLGLERDVALEALDRRGRSDEQIADLVSMLPAVTGIAPLLPPEAAPFFRADLVTAEPEEPVVLGAGFGIVVVLDGAGQLRFDERALEVRAGDTVLIPFSAGDVGLDGSFVAVLCRPPAATG